DLGVIEACHPSNEDGAFQACVALEALGAAGFPGPVPQTVAAAAVLGPTDWPQVSDGRRIVTFGLPPLIPWAAEAQIVLVVQDDRVHRLDGPMEPAATLAETGSGRAPSPQGPGLAAAAPALARYDM